MQLDPRPEKRKSGGAPKSARTAKNLFGQCDTGKAEAISNHTRIELLQRGLMQVREEFRAQPQQIPL